MRAIRPPSCLLVFALAGATAARTPPQEAPAARAEPPTAAVLAILQELVHAPATPHWPGFEFGATTFLPLASEATGLTCVVPVQPPGCGVGGVEPAGLDVAAADRDGGAPPRA